MRAARTAAILVSDVPRSSLCLSCRTVLALGEPCDVCGKEVAADLGTARGRDLAFHVAWASVDTERAWPGWVYAAIFIALLVLTIAGTIWGVQAQSQLGWIILFGGPVLMCGVFFLPLIVAACKRREPRPRGTAVRPEPPAGRESHAGRVAERAGRGPAAEALELALDDGRVTLRDARSLGFEVALDSGQTLLVPAGRVRLQAPAGAARSPEAARLEAWLRDVAPAGRCRELFPRRRAAEVVVRPGDRVRVVAETSFEKLQGPAYRESGRLIARLDPTPWIVIET
jgi:hypothetical protein